MKVVGTGAAAAEGGAMDGTAILNADLWGLALISARVCPAVAAGAGVLTLALVFRKAGRATG